MPQRGKSRPRRRSAPSPAPDTFTLAEVATAVGGRLVGRGAVRLTGVATLADAGPKDLSFVTDARYASAAGASAAGAFLVSDGSLAAGRPAVVVPSPGAALAVWLTSFRPASRPRAGVARGAHVHRTARLGRGVSVAAGATVSAGRANRSAHRPRSGRPRRRGRRRRRRMRPRAARHRRGSLHRRESLHPPRRRRRGLRRVRLRPRRRGAPQGSAGGNRTRRGRRRDRRQLDDRPRRPSARPSSARGTKIDNLVQVGHNVRIGEHCSPVRAGGHRGAPGSGAASCWPVRSGSPVTSRSGTGPC